MLLTIANRKDQKKKTPNQNSSVKHSHTKSINGSVMCSGSLAIPHYLILLLLRFALCSLPCHSGRFHWNASTRNIIFCNIHKRSAHSFPRHLVTIIHSFRYPMPHFPVSHRVIRTYSTGRAVGSQLKSTQPKFITIINYNLCDRINATSAST